MVQKQAKIVRLPKKSDEQHHVLIKPSASLAPEIQRRYKCDNPSCQEFFETGRLEATECTYCGSNDFKEVNSTDRKPRWTKKNE